MFLSSWLRKSGMGIVWLSPEFRLFDGPQGHSRDSPKLGEKMFMCIRSLQLRFTDAVHSSSDFVCHFILIQFVVSWFGGVLFENGLVSSAYVRFVEACKRDCGRRN